MYIHAQVNNIYVYVYVYMCVCVYMSNYIDMCVRETQYRYCPRTQVFHIYIHTQVNDIYIFIYIYICACVCI